MAAARVAQSAVHAQKHLQQQCAPRESVAPVTAKVREPTVFSELCSESGSVNEMDVSSFHIVVSNECVDLSNTVDGSLLQEQCCQQRSWSHKFERASYADSAPLSNESTSDSKQETKRHVERRFGSANANTLLANKKQSDANSLSGRVQVLERQFLDANLDFIGVQEGRTKFDQRTSGIAYEHFIAGCDESGCYGVQVWAHKCVHLCVCVSRVGGFFHQGCLSLCVFALSHPTDVFRRQGARPART